MTECIYKIGKAELTADGVDILEHLQEKEVYNSYHLNCLRLLSILALGLHGENPEQMDDPETRELIVFVHDMRSVIKNLRPPQE